MMFKIYTKRVFEFHNRKTGQKIVSSFMGFTAVDDWVRDDPMFQMGLKTGSISIIENTAQQTVLENGGDPNPELTELRAIAAELKIPRASQMGVEKLKTAIAAAKAQRGSSEPAGLDADTLRKYAEENSIDISALSADASANELRTAIEGAKE